MPQPTVGRRPTAKKLSEACKLAKTNGYDCARYQLIAAATYLADSVALTQIAIAK